MGRTVFVAGGFLQKWLGASPPGDPEVTAALVELERLAEHRPALGSAVAVLRDLLPPLFAEPVREQPPPLEQDQVAARLQAGLPLLRGETIALDADAFRRRWLAVCDAVQKHQPDRAAQVLAQALRASRLHPVELLTHVLAGQPEQVHAQAEELGCDPGLTATVLRLTLFPVLSHLWQQVSKTAQFIPPSPQPLSPATGERGAAPTLPPRHSPLSPATGERGGNLAHSWQQGYCPCCGSWPLLGEFRGLEQIRFLRCGLCAGEWEFPRSRCPFCSNSDHRLLNFFHAEGEEARCRAAACDRCHGYVKMVTTLQALSGPRLLAADLATMHLDLVMLERGYAASP